MSRRPNITPNVQVNVAIPQDLHGKMFLLLYSELEQRVPVGAYSRLFSELLRDYFQNRKLDLAPYLGSADSGAFLVSANPQTLSLLKTLLDKGQSNE